MPELVVGNPGADKCGSGTSDAGELAMAAQIGRVRIEAIDVEGARN
jgi:hypothetical protein